MSRQLAIGALVGFALAIASLSLLERRPSAPTQPTGLDAGGAPSLRLVHGPRALELIDREVPPLLAQPLSPVAALRALAADGGR